MEKEKKEKIRLGQVIIVAGTCGIIVYEYFSHANFSHHRKLDLKIHKGISHTAGKTAGILQPGLAHKIIH